MANDHSIENLIEMMSAIFVHTHMAGMNVHQPMNIGYKNQIPQIG